MSAQKLVVSIGSFVLSVSMQPTLAFESAPGRQRNRMLDIGNLTNSIIVEMQM